jgi:hypothetical protein
MRDRLWVKRYAGTVPRHETKSLASQYSSTQEYDPMQLDEISTGARELAQTYRITEGDTFRLQDIDPEDTAGLEAEDKPRAQEGLRMGVQALAVLQDMLYAQDRWAVSSSSRPWMR